MSGVKAKDLFKTNIKNQNIMTREAAIKWAKEIKAFQDGKTIQYYNKGDKQWYIIYEPSFSLDTQYRIKPEEQEPTKRLPTIEEVEKWFLENKVFVYKVESKNILNRIAAFDKKNQDNETIQIGSKWKTIEQFCKDYTHYDGTELYITEN